MNKIVKSIASVTLAFGTMLGVSTTVYQSRIQRMRYKAILCI